MTCLHHKSCSIAWAKIVHLALALPLALPILSTVLAICGPVFTLFMVRVSASARKNAISFLAPYIHYLLPLLPFTLLILSLVYGIPSELSSCSLESQWSHLFRIKSVQIQTIEQSLRCCGLNSLHDRAWPFPGQGVDARACERTLGYTTRCVNPWQRQQQAAAGLVALASIFNWLLLV